MAAAHPNVPHPLRGREQVQDDAIRADCPEVPLHGLARPARRLGSANGSMALAVVVLLVALCVVLIAIPYLRQPAVPIKMQHAPGRTTAHAVATAVAPTAQVQADFSALRSAIDAYRAVQGRLPGDDSELQQAWRDRFDSRPFPADPYNGQPYAYRTTDGEYSLTSAGPNLRFSSGGQ
jgi:hypothetical protein